MARADQIEAAIIGESARWGDAREGQVVNPYTSLGPFNDGHIFTGNQPIPLMTVNHWRESIDYVHDSFLVNAGDLLIQRMLSRGLYVSQEAPEFSINGSSQHGGAIDSGSLLTITGPGTIYFTLDGSDPRDGNGNAVGTLYNGGVTLDTTTIVKARTLVGGQWSPLAETVFTADDRSIVISEINYNPHDPTPAELAAIPGVDNDDFEFLEIYNANATESINLNGFRLSDGVAFTFGNITLDPGEHVLVVENIPAFRERYGPGLPIAGQWSGGLSNGGETIQLLNSLGVETIRVRYNDVDPWPVAADGGGSTLVLNAPNETPSEELGKHYRWRGGAEYGGSPGILGIDLPGVVINEVLTNSDFPQVDRVELHNPTNTDIEIGGWFLSDSDQTLTKYAIPTGTTLGAGQYIVFNQNQLGFALRSDSDDQVYLTAPVPGGVQFMDQVEFGPTRVGQSLGRVPNGSGRFAPLQTNTFGRANGTAAVGTLLISEVNYHPQDPSPAALAIDPTLTDDDLEFVEIQNPTQSAVSLANWRLRGESDFDFPALTLLPNAAVVVVSFDPSNAARAAAFRAHYGMGPQVPLIGGFAGQLNNGFARITLQQPREPSPLAPHVIADEVLYDDLAPWPTTADGAGQSLERVGPTMFGNDATSWIPASPTPGFVNYTPTLAGDYDRNGTVEQNDFLVWVAAFGSTIAVNADGSGNGIVDAADYTIWRDNLGATLPVPSGDSPFADPEESRAADQVDKVVPTRSRIQLAREQHRFWSFRKDEARDKSETSVWANRIDQLFATDLGDGNSSP